MQSQLHRRPGASCGKIIRTQRRAGLRVQASVHARWCLDVRYGCKAEATALLQEWVSTVGSKAGLTAPNTRLSSGCLGVPESRLEMEVTFQSMADWEAFIAALPFQEHKAWTQRIQSMVVDGSPVWQVYRSVPVLDSSTAASSAVARGRATVTRGPRQQVAPAGGGQLVITDQISTEDMLAWRDLTNTADRQQQQQQQEQQEPRQSGPAADAPLDWKGEPMKLNPGDKLPFKFL